jgi:micrococcal nuclease
MENKNIFRGFPIILTALCLIAWGSSFADPGKSQRNQTLPDSGQVVVVYDGDTVKVRFADGGERKVRLIGIDSPEMDDPREEVRFMAFIAKRFAFLNLYRKNVHLAYDWELEDQYGRLLAYLTTDDGALFNELILKEGFAFAYRKFPFRKDFMERFKAAATDARRAGKGLWRKENPLEVPVSGARAYLGQLVSVRMTCAGFEERRSFAVLHSHEGGFEALVPKEFSAAFPGLKGLTGKTIVVSGLVEEFDGALQILLYLPMQIIIIK